MVAATSASRRVFSCHSAGAAKLKGGLHLDSLEAALKGGDSGPAIVLGQPEKSLLIDAVSYQNVDLRMPRALETLDQLVQQLERGQVSAIEAIDTLLAEEITIREGRRVKAALQMARNDPRQDVG